MTGKTFITALLLAFPVFCLVAGIKSPHTSLEKEVAGGDYTLVIKEYDWGLAVSRVILSAGESVSEVNTNDFSVAVERSAEGVEFTPEEASGQRTILYGYASDEAGNRVPEGKFISLVLLVGPDLVIGSPIKYVRLNNRGSNQWIDYKMTVTNTADNRVWDSENKRILPLVDDFDVTGSYTHKGQNLSYAVFEPKGTDEKFPLIIWLHGGGEGGTDPSIPLVANKAANYASEEIQAIMGGAYVLVPQSPTFWMQSASGEYTRGDSNDIYNEALMGLIKKYISDHPNVDPKRIYVGGCSNGGYMALKLILLRPDYFAAGFISALAYQDQHITDEQVTSIKEMPIWFVHSKDDPVTIPEETVVPLYKRLLNAGAKNVHFSFYDHVTDLTGFYGGDDYHYNGHWSWIYSHANNADFDFDGSPVMLNGRHVTIMEWMAAQSR
jgi:poly(3-hydroxybutyrate) depolymerase